MNPGEYIEKLYDAFAPEIYKGPEKTYDQFAEDYDCFYADPENYRDQSLMSEYINKMYEQKDLEIIQPACGTGILGKNLSYYGFKNLVGVDCSSKMLEQALKKNVYNKLYHLFITKDAFPEELLGKFELVVCTGSLAQTHIKPEGLSELFKLFDPNGRVNILIFTIKEVHYKDGYKQLLDEMESQGKIKMIHVETYEKFGRIADSKEFLKKEAESKMFVYKIIGDIQQ